MRSIIILTKVGSSNGRKSLIKLLENELQECMREF